MIYLYKASSHSANMHGHVVDISVRIKNKTLALLIQNEFLVAIAVRVGDDSYNLQTLQAWTFRFPFPVEELLTKTETLVEHRPNTGTVLND